MPNRRKFLQGLSSVPLLGGALTNLGIAAPAKREFWKELGIKPFINAAGTYTTLTASLMHPEVVQAIEYASKQFVRLQEVHDAVGKKIASLVGSESAMVTAGAASALTLGTAACMTGTSQEFIRRLPDTAGMKTEVIIQKSHRYGYDHAVRNCGIKFIEVETREELERAINERTVMMLFFNANENKGQIKAAEFAELGKKHRIPTMNDAAADVPPVENFSKYIKQGFDLVVFSGGKGIRGPQSCGLLLGREDLIAAARLNGPPFSDSIGRGMKVNKEELVGMMVAVELYVKRDHQAEWREWEKRIKIISDSAGSNKAVKMETHIPEIANAVPHLRITWDADELKITRAEVVKQLREGDPAIELSPGGPKNGIEVAVWMLQPGEERIVAKRIREVLRKA
ncbi:MAG: selenocysteine synthase [Bryobacteraceae bacterium]